MLNKLYYSHSFIHGSLKVCTQIKAFSCLRMNPLCYKIFISSPKEQNALQSVWCHLPWSLQCWTTPLYFASCLCVFVYFCEFWFPPGLFLFWRWWFPTFSISNAAIKLWLQLAAWLFCRWFSSCLCFSCSSLSWTLLSLFSLRDDLLAGHRSLAGFLCWKMDSWLSSVQKYWCSQTFSSGCVFSLFYRKSEEIKSVLIICRFLLYFNSHTTNSELLSDSIYS